MSLIVEFVFPSPHDSGEDGGRNGTHGPKLATGEPGRTLPPESEIKVRHETRSDGEDTQVQRRRTG